MPLLTPGPAKARYIVRSDNPQVLAGFIEQASKDPELELLDTIGPPGAPHTAVFLMPNEKAQALQQRFATPNSPGASSTSSASSASSTADTNRLIIERDRPLSLFENGAH